MNSLWWQKKIPILVLLCLLGGTVLRFAMLDHQSLWQDEIHTAVYVTDNPSLVEVIDRVTSQDLHSPAYYIMLWMEVKVLQFFKIPLHGGHLRLLSAFLGVLAMITVWLFIRKLFERSWLGLLGMFLAAISSYALFYSQELRMYALVLAFAPAFLYFQLSLWEGEQGKLKPIMVIGYIVTGWILLYTSLVSLFLVAGAGVGLFVESLLDRKKNPGRWQQVLLVGGVLVAGYLPWIGAMWRKSMMLSGGVHTGLVIQHPRELFKFAFENLLFHSWKMGGTYGLINKVFRIFILFSLVNLWNPQTGKKHRMIQIGFLLTFLVYFFITLGKPFHTGRYFSPWWPFAIYFMVASFTGAFWLGQRYFKKWSWSIIVLFLLFYGWTGVVQAQQMKYYFTQYTKEDWRGIAGYLDTHMTPQDAIVVNNDWHQTCFEYYDVRLPMISLDQLDDRNILKNYKRLVYIENQGPEALPSHLTDGFHEKAWPFRIKRLFLYEIKASDGIEK